MEPQQPKRPLSSYFIWLSENREAIKRSNPDLKSTEVAKKGGELWREIADKSKWERKAVEAKELYNQAMEEFKARGGSVAAPKKRKTAKKSPVKQIKRVVSRAVSEDEEESD